MSELTQNTINFCRHAGPFRSDPQPAGTTVVRDKRGLAVCQCERIDDAWTIAEALNEVGANALGLDGGRRARPTQEQKDEFWHNA